MKDKIGDIISYIKVISFLAMVLSWLSSMLFGLFMPDVAKILLAVTIISLIVIFLSFVIEIIFDIV